jgi:uncharacterized protein
MTLQDAIRTLVAARIVLCRSNCAQWNDLVTSPYNDRTCVVNKILERSASKYKEATYEDSLIISAARWGRAEIVEALLTEVPSININAVTSYNRSALAVAVVANRHSVVNVLLALGADKNMLDRNGWTPLMHAVGHGYLDITSALLDAGADIHIKNRKGWSAKSIAKQTGHLVLVRLLSIVDERQYQQ